MSVRRYSLRRPRSPRALAALGLLLVPLLALGTATGAPPSRRPAPAHVLTIPPGPVRITATAAVLMDARSGQVLYSRNPHLVWPPASTTKIMTALVALESTPLNALVPISPQVAHFRQGSVVGLPAGAHIPLHDLLYGLMLPSGNDVALAVAEGVAGTVSAFVARMNDEARRLGATQTHFTSPHGLYEVNHFSTAYDLAMITRAAMQNPTFREIVRTRQWTFTPPVGPSRPLWNHNRLLTRYPGADGVKTGYVHESGYTLAASASHDGWRLIAVILHSKDMWGDASRLLSYGFARYRPVELARAGEELAAITIPGANQPVLGTVADDIYAALQPGQVPVRRVSLVSRLALPVRRGERVGEVDFYVSGHLLRSAPLVAARGVSAHADLEWMAEWVGRMVRNLAGATVL